jgi:hypothetical protein
MTVNWLVRKRGFYGLNKLENSSTVFLSIKIIFNKPKIQNKLVTANYISLHNPCIFQQQILYLG